MYDLEKYRTYICIYQVYREWGLNITVQLQSYAHDSQTNQSTFIPNVSALTESLLVTYCAKTKCLKTKKYYHPYTNRLPTLFNMSANLTLTHVAHLNGFCPLVCIWMVRTR